MKCTSVEPWAPWDSESEISDRDVQALGAPEPEIAARDVQAVGVLGPQLALHFGRVVGALGPQFAMLLGRSVKQLAFQNQRNRRLQFAMCNQWALWDCSSQRTEPSSGRFLSVVCNASWSSRGRFGGHSLQCTLIESWAPWDRESEIPDRDGQHWALRSRRLQPAMCKQWAPWDRSLRRTESSSRRFETSVCNAFWSSSGR